MSEVNTFSVIVKLEQLMCWHCGMTYAAPAKLVEWRAKSGRWMRSCQISGCLT